MSIRRGKRPQNDFTIIQNTALRDANLSFRARGVMAYILTHAEEWQTSIDDIARHGKEGREAVRTAVAELEEAGYLQRERHQDGHGHWRVDYILWEIPNPATGFRGEGFQSQGNRPTDSGAPANGSVSEDHYQKTTGQKSTSEDAALAGARAEAPGSSEALFDIDEPPAPAKEERNPATLLVEWWWERQEPKPAGRGAWFASLNAVRAVLAAGWTPAQVGQALKVTVPPLSVGTLEFALNSSRRVPPAQAARRQMIDGWLADANGLDQSQPPTLKGIEA